MNPDIKKGIIGILNLTKAPKLEVEIATEKEKKIANIKQNNTNGFDIIFITAVIGFFTKTYITKNIINKFSIPEKIITIFFDSHI